MIFSLALSFTCIWISRFYCKQADVRYFPFVKLHISSTSIKKITNAVELKTDCWIYCHLAVAGWLTFTNWFQQKWPRPEQRRTNYSINDQFPPDSTPLSHKDSSTSLASSVTEEFFCLTWPSVYEVWNFHTDIFIIDGKLFSKLTLAPLFLQYMKFICLLTNQVLK